MEVSPGSILRLVGFLECTPTAAAVAPVLIGPDGAPQTYLYRRFPSVAQLLLFWTVLEPLARRVPFLRRRYFEHDLRGRTPILADQLPGASMLIRHSALREIGALDPDYFLWCEDLDWCYRAREAGALLYVLPQVHMKHEGGVSFRSWSLERRVYQSYRAFFRFLCKHRPDHLLGLALPLVTMNLRLWEAVLWLLHALRLLRRDETPTFARARRAIREVVERHRRGELVRFVDAGPGEGGPPLVIGPA